MNLCDTDILFSSAVLCTWTRVNVLISAASSFWANVKGYFSTYVTWSKAEFKKKMPQVTLYSHYVSCGADISVIIDIFTQEGSKCMKNRQFNSQIAHFLWAHSLFTFPFPNFLLQTTGGETYFLVLFFLLCASLSDFISHEWISHSPYLSL